MRLWARLTWQAPRPASLAADLEQRILVPARRGGLVPGARLLDLGVALLEVRPWISEGPDDVPRAGGRLLLEPVPGGDEPLRGAGPEPDDAAGPRGTQPPGDAAMTLAAIGWATVELERAERELAAWLGAGAPGGVHDPHLGARGRLHRGGSLPGEWWILLEPSREGRVAASLARDSEGPCAIYLRPAEGLDAWVATARDREVAMGSLRAGPLGRQVRLAGPPAGPHVIVSEGRSPVSRGIDAGTIAP